MDVNERIVEEWAHLCKHQFTIPNVSFSVPHNYGDVDILAYDPKEKRFYEYEVKFRSTSFVGTTKAETLPELIRKLFSVEREKKIREIIGDVPCQKIFVTSGIFLRGKKGTKSDELVREFRKRKIEILTFEKILDDLKEKITTKGRYNSETSQVLRMLKLYKGKV